MSATHDIEILSQLFINNYGKDPEIITRLAGAGSGRRYYRLVSGSDCCIGVGGENERDCRAFVSLAGYFRSKDMNVPEVYCHSTDYMHYLQEDLGDISLFSLIGKGIDVEGIVAETMRSLARMQTLSESEWIDLVEYHPFGRRQIFWDLNYYKYEYLRASGFDFDEELLENDFDKLADALSDISDRQEGFMYRDCQSRNVMIKGDTPFFIDFQGGRRGPLLYDAVSFLWQAKASFSDSFRERMMDVYAMEIESIRGITSGVLLEKLDLFILFRTLQVLGAYGLRGLVEHKAHFIESIPYALENLRKLIDRGALDPYPELKRIGEELIVDPRFIKEKRKELKVTVFSFSYKKGYPADYSGNGGGFMFDCRGMHNPGRYEEYKSLTGRDLPVIEFLEEKGETEPFCDKAVDMVSPVVERYRKRGFTSLQIGSGCTGGQHRSVYCCERTAGILKERFPDVEIEIIHREQKLRRTL